MLPESTIKELQDLKLMAKAVIETVDRLVEVKEKPINRVDMEFEKWRSNKLKRRQKKQYANTAH